ncbi:MAG: hypothetical protein PHP50_07945 [Lachnospiraceae bacterium]|nr:hypothetical protein [Lachnospiraceae bacterium]
MKNIIACDDEKRDLSLLDREVHKVLPDCSMQTFLSASDAVTYALDCRKRKIDIDLAFINVSISGVRGVELAESLRGVFPEIAIVYTVENPDFTQRQNWDVTLCKPISVLELGNVLDKVIGVSGKGSRMIVPNTVR